MVYAAGPCWSVQRSSRKRESKCILKERLLQKEPNRKIRIIGNLLFNVKLKTVRFYEELFAKCNKKIGLITASVFIGLMYVSRAVTIFRWQSHFLIACSSICSSPAIVCIASLSTGIVHDSESVLPPPASNNTFPRCKTPASTTNRLFSSLWVNPKS